MYDEYEFFDDVLNKPLDKEEAIKARRLEIDFFRARKVYEKVPRHLAAGHKIISTKWLDVDRGTSSGRACAQDWWVENSSSTIAGSTCSQQLRPWSLYGCSAQSVLQTTCEPGHTGCSALM